MGIEHTAYRQYVSVFGIASISNTDFTNTTPKNSMFGVIGLRLYENRTLSILPN